MIRKRKISRKRVLFNASVVLSGLRSPKGASGFLLKLVSEKKIDGEISEIIFDEILRHSEKLGLEKKYTAYSLLRIFPKVLDAPSIKTVDLYKKIVFDEGDAHVLASCRENKINCLVTLDKKHLLILKGKVKTLDILTPGELVGLLKRIK